MLSAPRNTPPLTRRLNTDYQYITFMRHKPVFFEIVSHSKEAFHGIAAHRFYTATPVCRAHIIIKVELSQRR